MNDITYNRESSFPLDQDEKDGLKGFRAEYHIPVKNGKETIYFCGNSLGLQPKNASDYLSGEMNRWKTMGVEGHFTDENPWVYYHKNGRAEMARLVGAKPSEVIAMNNLTTNLHLMLASFYQPTSLRRKVIIEAGAFPSDHFAVTSHMQQKGIDVEENLIEVEMDESGYLSNELICKTIEDVGTELALVLLPGIQYYSGQFLNISAITAASHKVGALVGFDLAHAAGNLPMSLHDDKVDFAVWCSYKYLNSGPGNLSGVFIHETHSQNTNFPRLAGWWGQDEKTRFKMENVFTPMKGADGWMLSNMNILTTAIHIGALKLFDRAGIENLRAKSVRLTGYLEYLLLNSVALQDKLKIITPSNLEERGCQLSLSFHENGRQVFDHLIANNVVLDWREPNVIRVAPTPMYNTFQEVYRFVKLLEEAI
ncbi:MAG: kynureninase [Cyclobacteriaceae bacterium]